MSRCPFRGHDPPPVVGRHDLPILDTERPCLVPHQVLQHGALPCLYHHLVVGYVPDVERERVVILISSFSQSLFSSWYPGVPGVVVVVWLDIVRYSLNLVLRF